MNNESLKAQLFDLLNNKTYLENRIAMLLNDVADRDDEIEEMRGDVHRLTNIAEQRAEMIHGLIAENRKLKQQLLTPAPTNFDIAEVQEHTIERVIDVVKDAYKKGVLDF